MSRVINNRLKKWTYPPKSKRNPAMNNVFDICFNFHMNTLCIGLGSGKAKSYKCYVFTPKLIPFSSCIHRYHMIPQNMYRKRDVRRQHHQNQHIIQCNLYKLNPAIYIKVPKNNWSVRRRLKKSKKLKKKMLRNGKM